MAKKEAVSIPKIEPRIKNKNPYRRNTDKLSTKLRKESSVWDFSKIRFNTRMSIFIANTPSTNIIIANRALGPMAIK